MEWQRQVSPGGARSGCSPLPPWFWSQFWSLGRGRDHVMDALAQCEQLARERARVSARRPGLCFRKVLHPWHDSPGGPGQHPHLIYRQILHGVWLGEYPFEKVGDHGASRSPKTHLSDSLGEGPCSRAGTLGQRGWLRAGAPATVPRRLGGSWGAGG